MRCFSLAIHVAKRHLVLYIDVEFNTFFSSLAVSSEVSSLAVKHICRRRPVSMFGKQAYTTRTTVRLLFQQVEWHLLYFTGDVILAALRRLDNTPSEHDTLTQCWVKVRTMSSTLAQQL